ncbi:MAG: hypothetical protein AABY00_01975 [Nanoarchaeota archaeon]
MKNVVFVVFGGTGDLMKRKLAPAIAKLVVSGIMNKDSVIIGVSRKKMSNEEYQSLLVNSAHESEKEALRGLQVLYTSGDASRPRGLDSLMELLNKYTNYEKIFYLATSFTLFSPILSVLKKAEFDRGSKIVFEKPFGSDLLSSDALNNEITSFAPEESIYRIDHYLAKETVLNLTTLKFTNPLVEEMLQSRFVERIEVIADEDLGVGDRLEYYHVSGAIKDMIQSHLLQILALLLMDRSENVSAQKMHQKKYEILSQIVPVVSNDNLLGQYRSYADELHAKNLVYSRTETFARIFLECKNDRWKGVPLVLRTGKKLKRKYGQIVIHFKQLAGFPSNKLIIDIYPQQNIAFLLNSRIPGSADVKPVRLEFCHDCEFGPNTPDEYSVLLGEILAGNALLFPRYEEIRESWRIVERIEKMKGTMKFVVYDDLDAL